MSTPGNLGPDRGASAWSAGDREQAAMLGDPVAHGPQSGAGASLVAAGRVWGEPAAIVGHREADVTTVSAVRNGAQVDGDEARPRMPHGIAQCLLGNPERSEEHTSELQSRQYLVCRLLLEKKNGEQQAEQA